MLNVVACLLGTPSFRLLRHEVEALVLENKGESYLHKKKLENELAENHKRAWKLRTDLATLQQRQNELKKQLIDAGRSHQQIPFMLPEMSDTAWIGE